MADISTLSDDELKNMALQHISDADLTALHSGSQNVQPSSIPSVDPYARDLHLANPMGQSMSNIPAGQSVLPTDAAASKEGVAGYEMHNAKWDNIPTFVKQLDMVGTGAMKGSLTFTNMLNALGSDTVRSAVQTWDKRYNDLTQQFPSSNLPEAGKFAAEMISPVGLVASKGLGLVTAGAKAAAAIAPTGLGTLTKYGISGIGGAGVLAGMESQRQDGSGDVINVNAAKDALTNPAAALMSMAGTKASVWADASRKLGEAQQLLPSTMAVQVKPAGAARTFEQEFLGALPALTGMGARVNQINGIGDELKNFVSTVAGSKEAQGAVDLTEFAAKKFRDSMDKMGAQEDKLWNMPFKTAPINNPAEVGNHVSAALDVLDGSGIPTAGRSSKLLRNALSGLGSSDPSLTAIGSASKGINVEGVKQIQTIIGNAAGDAYSMENGTGNEMGAALSKIRSGLTDTIQGSIPADQMKDFMAARQFSANKYQMFDNAPMVQKAIGDEANSVKLIQSLQKDSGTMPPKRLAVSGLNGVGGMDSEGRAATDASIIASAIKASDIDGNGKINLDTFTKKMSDDMQNTKILSGPTMGAIQGLNKILGAVSEGSKVGWWRQAAILGGALTATGAGAGMAAGLGAAVAVPLASYAAISMIANHSPLKTLLNAATKNLPKETYDAVVKAVTSHLTRAGYIITQDGTVQHKDEQ